mmetsp:Transcript_10240/g.26516  ORF Transcript_10240/g.26516 Transcript_10240/m.26516 type:complete len:207 (-) Transcript_10240:28-648(-)
MRLGIQPVDDHVAHAAADEVRPTLWQLPEDECREVIVVKDDDGALALGPHGGVAFALYAPFAVGDERHLPHRLAHFDAVDLDRLLRLPIGARLRRHVHVELALEEEREGPGGVTLVEQDLAPRQHALPAKGGEHLDLLGAEEGEVRAAGVADVGVPYIHEVGDQLQVPLEREEFGHVASPEPSPLLLRLNPPFPCHRGCGQLPEAK